MSRVEARIRYKRYPASGRTILRDIHFVLEDGTFTALTGPSGCGKTTLLNILAGLDRDFVGDVRLSTCTGRDPVVGMVFQNPRLLPWRTVAENVRLAQPEGSDPGEVMVLLEGFGLADAANVYPERLSGGMARRVAMARAFALRPDLLLLDEPFVSLDAETAANARRLLHEFRGRWPCTVLLVTHDLVEAGALSGQLIRLALRATSCDPSG